MSEISLRWSRVVLMQMPLDLHSELRRSSTQNPHLRQGLREQLMVEVSDANGYQA